MSYDICLVIDTGNPDGLTTVVEIGNYTSNVSPMWSKALGFPLRDLSEWSAADAISPLQKAVYSMKEPSKRAEYLEMNPKNGWGDFDSAIQYLERLLNECHKHPKTTIWINC